MSADKHKRTKTSKKRIILYCAIGGVVIAAVIGGILLASEYNKDVHNNDDKTGVYSGDEVTSGDRIAKESRNSSSEEMNDSGGDTESGSEVKNDNSDNNSKKSDSNKKDGDNHSNSQLSQDNESSNKPGNNSGGGSTGSSENSSSQSDQPKEEGKDFTIYKFATTPVLYSSGTLSHGWNAVTANGTNILMNCNDGEYCTRRTPLDQYKNVSCDIYQGNTLDDKVKKYTIRPMTSETTLMVPYGYNVNNVCSFLSTYADGGEHRIANGRWIEDDIDDGYANISTYSETVYYDYSFRQYTKSLSALVDNTYPNF